MAVKLTYDATKGLVQKEDPTGAGGFELTGAFISEGVEGADAPVAAAAAADANKDLATQGVSLVSTTAAADKVNVPDPAAENIGQTKTVIYKSAANAADTLVVHANGGAIATLADAGDLVMLMWDGSDWRVVGQG